jgi:hypothetical protein
VSAATVLQQEPYLLFYQLRQSDHLDIENFLCIMSMNAFVIISEEEFPVGLPLQAYRGLLGPTYLNDEVRAEFY